MKLLIKKEYFKAIEQGSKTLDYRDAHITFVCEETGATIRKEVTHVTMMERPPELYPDVLQDKNIIRFTLG